MPKKDTISSYHNTFLKSLLDIAFILAATFFTFPIMILIAVLIKLSTPELVFYKQKRVGLKGKVFEILKFRTMVPHSEKKLTKLRNLNEADGPVFKIYNDPRYTPLGKFLAHTGLDELPQLLNVFRGEMSFVGPRPLPTYEANRLTRKQKLRELVKPGITSSWVIRGSHSLKFNHWMKLDLQYVENASIFTDIEIIFKTIKNMLTQFLNEIQHLK
jgi:lipopolysaccharide/colanic/teichoic acid biosynthesis glycosyltransferase